MQSWMALLVAGMLIGPGSGVTAASVTAATVSTAVEAVVDQAHEQWFAGLGVRQSCSSGVSIVFEALPSRRGEYRTATEQVVIDPGDSLDGMDGVVIHELSHHTFLACGAFADADLTQAFYAAQGLPSGRDWFDYSLGWTQTPAEHFAEVMAVTLSGGGEGGITISSAAVEVISKWLAGAVNVMPTVDIHDPVPYSENGVPTTPVLIIDRSDDPPSARAPQRHESPARPVTLEFYGEVLELVSRSFRIGVFWLNSWRAIGSI